MFEGTYASREADRKAGRPRTAPTSKQLPPSKLAQSSKAADDWAIGTGHPYNKAHEQRQDWQVRSMPNNRVMEAARQQAWMDASALLPDPKGGWKTATAPRSGGGGAVSSPLNMTPNRMRAHVQAMSRKPAEELAMELMQTKNALHAAREENRKLGAENGRLAGQLKVAQQNVLKAEELLNNRERELSPTQGLSQMYRSPDTTALVGRLKEHASLLIVERDRLLAENEAGKKEKRATRLSELQSQVACLTEELQNQKATNDVLKEQLLEAQALADGAAKQTAQAMVTLKQYLRTGEGVPMPPPKIAPSGSLSSAKFGATLASLRKAHTAMLSQAQLIRALFPQAGMSMEQLDRAAIQRTSTLGAGDVLRCLRVHLKRLAIELHGLPGGYHAVDDEAGLHAPAGLQDPAISFKHALAEHVRKLRTFTPDMYTDDIQLQVELQDVWDLVAEIQQEACRLVGHWHHHTPVKGTPTVEAEAKNNPLYSNEPAPCWSLMSQFGDDDTEEQVYVGAEASEGQQSSAAPLSAVDEAVEEVDDDEGEEGELVEEKSSGPGRRVQVCDLVASLAKYQSEHGVTLDQMVERFDANGDGRLQPCELRNFLTALLGRIPEKEHRYLQAMLDNDGDGDISVSELRLVVRHAADLRTSCVATDTPVGTQMAVDSCARAIAESKSRAKRLFAAVQADGTCSFEMLTLPHLRNFFSHLCPDMKQRDMRCVLAYLHYKDVHEDLFSWDILCQALQVERFMQGSVGDAASEQTASKAASGDGSGQNSRQDSCGNRSISLASRTQEPVAVEPARSHSITSSHHTTSTRAESATEQASRATTRTVSAVSRAQTEELSRSSSSREHGLSSKPSLQQSAVSAISEQPQATYSIKVETGTSPGSATTAQRVLVTLIGQGGRSTELVLPRLDASTAGKPRFGRGAVDVFSSMTACDVGELSAVIVRVEEAQDGSPAVSWQLDTVSVSKSGNPHTWVFDFANWIGAKYGYSHRLSLSYTTGGEGDDEEEEEEEAQEVATGKASSYASSIKSSSAAPISHAVSVAYSAAVTDKSKASSVAEETSVASSDKSKASSVAEEASVASTAASEQPSVASSMTEQRSASSIAASEASKSSASGKSATSKASGSASNRSSKSKQSQTASRSVASSVSKASLASASPSVTPRASQVDSQSAASQSLQSQASESLQSQASESAASELNQQASVASAASEAASSKVSSKASSLFNQHVRGLSSQSSRHSNASRAASSRQDVLSSKHSASASRSVSREPSQAASEASRAASKASQAASEVSQAASEVSQVAASSVASQSLQSHASRSQRSLGEAGSRSQRSLGEAGSRSISAKSTTSLAFPVLEEGTTPGGSAVGDPASQAPSSRPRSAASEAPSAHLQSKASSKAATSRQASIISAKSGQASEQQAPSEQGEEAAGGAHSVASEHAGSAADSPAEGSAPSEPQDAQDAASAVDDVQEEEKEDHQSLADSIAIDDAASEASEVEAAAEEEEQQDRGMSAPDDDLQGEESEQAGSEAEPEGDEEVTPDDEEVTPDDDEEGDGDEVTPDEEESPAGSADVSQENDEESPAASGDVSQETGEEESPSGSADVSQETGEEESPPGSADVSQETGEEESPSGSADVSQETGEEESPSGSADVSQETGEEESPSGSADVSQDDDNADDGSPAASGDVSQETAEDEGEQEEGEEGEEEEEGEEGSAEASGDVSQETGEEESPSGSAEVSQDNDESPGASGDVSQETADDEVEGEQEDADEEEEEGESPEDSADVSQETGEEGSGEVSQEAGEQGSNEVSQEAGDEPAAAADEETAAE